MKTRKHHNNTGEKQVKKGKTREQVKHMADRLNVPYGKQYCPGDRHQWESEKPEKGEPCDCGATGYGEY